MGDKEHADLTTEVGAHGGGIERAAAALALCESKGQGVAPDLDAIDLINAEAFVGCFDMSPQDLLDGLNGDLSEEVTGVEAVGRGSSQPTVAKSGEGTAKELGRQCCART